MKRLVVLAVALVTALSASAQQADGGISEAMLQNIRQNLNLWVGIFPKETEL